jgi:ribonuclease HI
MKRDMMESMNITVFTDGASRGNPGPGGWGAVLVFGNEKIKELGGSEKHTTNNRMELAAVMEALSFVSSQKSEFSKLIIHTDSSYVVNGITKWVSGWQARGWKTIQKEDVLNRDLWGKLSELDETLNPEWKLVPGHSAVAGNERCDEIATAFADGRYAKLYDGTFDEYPVQNILDISFNEEERKLRSASRARSAAPAYSYVSFIKGEIQIHKTWAECEKRVKGISGARFKKTLSAEDEAQIISDFKQKK